MDLGKLISLNHYVVSVCNLRITIKNQHFCAIEMIKC